MEETAIVILNFNGKEHLAKFLPSVVLHSSNYRIIVADNGSTDGSVSFLRERFPEIDLLLHDKNLGFAGGYNWALQQIEAKYYILLNSDVEVTKNWVEPLINVLKSSANIAVCQAKLLSYENKHYFEYAGAAGGFLDKYGYPFCRGRMFETTEEDHGQYDDTREVFWASGACMAITSEAFHNVGGFDADFFAHMEEIDLCWRIKQIGKQIYYTSASTVYHLGGGTLHKTNPRKTFLNFRNNLVMLLKNLPRRKLLPTIFLRMILDGIAAIRTLGKGNWGDFKAIINSHMAFYSLLPTTLKKRKNVVPVSGFYLKSVVKAYFIDGLKTFDKLSGEKFRF